MKNYKFHIIGMICVILIAFIGSLGLRYYFNNPIESMTNENQSKGTSNVPIDNNNNSDDDFNLEGTVNDKYPKFIEITLDQYVKAFKAGEKMILFTGRPTCNACSTFAPILEKVLEDYPDLIIYYIYSSNVDFESNYYNEFMTLDEAFKEGYTYIPWFILAADSKVVKDNIGVMTFEETVNMLKESNFIKK